MHWEVCLLLVLFNYDVTLDCNICTFDNKKTKEQVSVLGQTKTL